MNIIRIRKGRVLRQGKIVLQDVDLTIEKGEFRYLTGKSGSGKTSLLSAMYGAAPLEADEAIVAGTDLLTLDYRHLPEFRRKIGMIFQDFRLFEDKTARANLYIIMKATGWQDEERIKSRIIEVLDSVGLQEKYKDMPGELSGGEKQRLSIARALLNHPELIIADEPTGNLDPETSDQIMQLIRKLTRENGVAVVFATHDYRLVEKFPSRVSVCREGRLIHN
ncbi:MAG: ATP-binding cassette domain-containing protein [Saprospiraceae bacterium]|nr:ATP-binding cassette domain-containing protein [Saprospiraceae bacterium]